MKICLINNLYKPYNRGGTERIVELQAEGLTKDGHEVFIISTRPLFRQHQTRAPREKIYYLKGLYHDLNKIPKIIRLFWHVIDIFDINSFLKIKSILKKEKPDIVITHNLKGLGYSIPRTIKYLKIKHLYVLHDTQLIHPAGFIIYGKEKIIDNFSTKIYMAACRWLFGSPDIIISPSNWLMKLHEKKNFFKESKKIILPHPSPDSSATPLLPRREAGSEIFRFLYVGQIEEHKGVLFLLEVWQSLCSKEISQKPSQPECELMVVGNGSKLEKAKKMATGDKSIQFLGIKNKNEISQLMLGADCLIIPSLCYENSPTVIYEATGLELAVLAPRLGGIPELVHDLGGILFKPGDKNDLARQIRWVMEHPKLLREIKEKNRKKIKKFQLKYYIEKLTALL